MTLVLTWQEIALRLLFAVIAGALIGFNRGEHGHAAGLRTTLLLCLAAAVAMLQANILLPSAGRSSDSFIMLDLMRLPLGILSGVGFIGAGAILRKGEMVHGVTTAATMWFVTVVGLCMGGGQLGLGSAALGLGLFVLWGLKWVENRLRQDRKAFFLIATRGQKPTELEIKALFREEGFKVHGCAITYLPAEHRRELSCTISWRSPLVGGLERPIFLEGTSRDPEILKMEWRPSQ
jgi:putative Mg2+ transporter-C (MgtC) family protein